MHNKGREKDERRKKKHRKSLKRRAKETLSQRYRHGGYLIKLLSARFEDLYKGGGRE